MEALDLNGRKGLVVAIASEHSLAWSAAEPRAPARAPRATRRESEKTSLLS
jgi:hypothetical protein